MTNFAKPRNRLALLGTAVLAGGILTGTLMPQVALAHLSYCRSDPTVWLTNGVKVTLVAQVGGSATDVTNISYSLHVPVGTHMTGVTFTGGPLRGKEVLRVVSSDAPNAYDATTTVSTTSTQMKVDVNMSVLDPGWGTPKTSGTASGLSSQQVNVHLKG